MRNYVIITQLYCNIWIKKTGLAEIEIQKMFRMKMKSNEV